MREKLYQYLKNVAHDVDFIVISGDHVYQHGNYDKAKDFYDKVAEVVPEKNEFIIVPGNHDVDRDDKARITIIRGLHSSNKYIDDIHEEKILESLLSPFKNYFVCIEDAFPDKFYRTPVQIYSSEKCDFILINTALTSYEKSQQPPPKAVA
jgi:predicted phosphodiesterase